MDAKAEKIVTVRSPRHRNGARSHRDDDDGASKSAPLASMKSRRQAPNFKSMQAEWESRASAMSTSPGPMPMNDPLSRYRQDMATRRGSFGGVSSSRKVRPVIGRPRGVLIKVEDRRKMRNLGASNRRSPAPQRAVAARSAPEPIQAAVPSWLQCFQNCLPPPPNETPF